MVRDYAEAVEFLYASLPMFQREGASAYKEGLDVSEALDCYDGFPHRSYVTVHVAGTNGKGSVAHMLASMLMASGMKVGLYTSPHFLDYRERIKVDGAPVPEEYVVTYLQAREEIIEELQPSFFELTTSMAFSYFQEAGVEIAVIEVGMGGRLDSTNVIMPALSVITSIGMDHMQFLGNTLEEIAREKGGIIKPGVPVVMSGIPFAARDVLIELCKVHNCQFEVSADIWRCESQQFNFDRQRIQMKNLHNGEVQTLETDLLSIAQGENVGVALSAANMLRDQGCMLNREAVVEGIRTVVQRTGIRGRWEWLRRGLNAQGERQTGVVCDTGHNAPGWQNVMRQLRRTPCKEMRMVIGVADDKDLDTMLPLLPKEARYYFTQASVPRALSSEALQKKAATHSIQGSAYDTVHAAIAAAMEGADPEDLVFVGGSSFVVADALNYEFT